MSGSVLQKRDLGLILVSFIMLFAEIALIRWVSTESRIFAYLNNLVLLSCFLGIGIGSYLSYRKIYIWLSIVLQSLLFLIIRLPLEITISGQRLHPFKDIPILLSSFSDSLIWSESDPATSIWMSVLGLLSILLMFLLILVIFVPLGQLLGRYFDSYKNIIRAYSLNVLASIIGSWCFALFSFFYIEPFYWFAFLFALFLLLYLIRPDRSRIELIGLGLALILLSVNIVFLNGNGDSIKRIWSPYQKLVLRPYIDKNIGINRGFCIDVNNIGYMTLLNLSDEFIEKNPFYFSKSLRRFSQYDIPYQLKTDPGDILILGSGGGNDVAGALRNGADTIDAVEIDPGIYQLGLQYHPENPYSDPCVNIFIDDARSFLKRTDRLYDIISFGLLDAHTLSSGYNNLRIDHYVYTRESFQEVERHLKDNGILTVIFAAQRPWIEKRLYYLLSDVFDSAPIAFRINNGGIYGWGGTMFITGRDRNAVQAGIDSNPLLKQYLCRNEIIFDNTEADNSILLTTDDWPYLYIEKATIPNMHLCLMVILALLFVVARKTILSGIKRINLFFFFLGAAFLLLEFQNISKCSLLFGSTWITNGIVISAILILILLANLFVARFPGVDLNKVYLLLAVSILTAFFIPLDIFNVFGYWQKSIISSVILNIPVFFAGIIFIKSFDRTPDKSGAFGANLLGAGVGGILESLSFIFGIKALLLVVLGFYLLSWYKKE